MTPRLSILFLFSVLAFFDMQKAAFADLVTLNYLHAGNVQSNNSGNFTEDVNISVKHQPGSIYTRVGYIKFDLSSIDGPVHDASLTFESGGAVAGSVSNSSFVYDFSVWVLNDGDSNEGWSPAISFEDGIGIDTSSHLADTSEASLVASFQQTGAGNSGDQFNLNTAALLSAVTADADDQLTMMIFRTQGSGNGNIVHGFQRDSFQLSVTVVPEPSTGFVALFGLAAFCLRRK